MPYDEQEVVEHVGHLLDKNDTHPTTAVGIITVMARSYTRGRGFNDDGEPNDEITAVVTTAAARLAVNGPQLPVDMSTGDFGMSVRGAFTGWTLAELAVLNRYRKRAM